jgi:hypothetical protein
MGQQQLLLIILGVIVVGIAVAVGITMFSDSAINANRDAMVNDLVNLASRAQQFYRRPSSLGGGGNSFAGSDCRCGWYRQTDEQACERQRLLLYQDCRHERGNRLDRRARRAGERNRHERDERSAGTYQSISQHRQCLDTELTLAARKGPLNRGDPFPYDGG